MEIIGGKLKLSEQQILNQIWTYLQMKQIPVVHVRNTGSIFHRDGKTFFGRPKFGQKGAADLIACVRGCPLAIEVKSAVGRLSPEQKDWLRNWGKNGGIYVVARSLEEVLTTLNSLKGRSYVQQDSLFSS